MVAFNYMDVIWVAVVIDQFASIAVEDIERFVAQFFICIFNVRLKEKVIIVFANKLCLKNLAMTIFIHVVLELTGQFERL